MNEFCFFYLKQNIRVTEDMYDRYTCNITDI